MRSNIITMSSFLYTLLGIAASSSLHCSVRQQISPCTCSFDMLTGPNILNVACEKMNSFAEVKHALKGHFLPPTRLKLRITHSILQDLHQDGTPGFGDLNVYVSHLNISDNKLTTLRAEAFTSMGNVTIINVADNLMTDVPSFALAQMPRLRTLNFGGNKLSKLNDVDLKDLKQLEVLVLSDNVLQELGRASMPRQLVRLATARNQLVTLNESLREAYNLEWLYIQQNLLTSLDEQLPTMSSKLVLLNASHNALRNLPSELKAQPYLETLLVDHNQLRSLGGALQKSKRLVQLGATYNQITALDEEEFTEAENLQELVLGHNQLSELNGALRPLRSLHRLSLHHNALIEFDLSEVRGLRVLQELDLRHNRIEHLVSKVEMQNVVEVDTKRVTELRLGHNLLASLDGFLLGLPGLRTLDLSHNRLRTLPPDELLGLDQLRFLDLSYNMFTSLADTAKKFLPTLETLLLGHNQLETVVNDLHGLPKLCVADLSYNKITRVGAEVAAKSACLVSGVPGTLRIFLQGNSLQCDADLSVAQEETENHHAELVGVPDCKEYMPAPTAPPVTVLLPSPETIIPDILPPSPPVINFPDILEELTEEIQPEMSNLALQSSPLLTVDEVTFNEAPVESVVPNNDEPEVVDTPQQQEDLVLDLIQETTLTPPAE